MTTAAADLKEKRAGPGTAAALEARMSFDTSGSLATQQVEEMVAAWRRGERPLAEDFLARHLDLGREGAIRLIFEEVALRQELGLEVNLEDIVRRFPHWREELAILLDCQRLMESKPPDAVFPRVGEIVAGFRLLAELGRGATGRVFLAAQPALADRPVVLKVTPRGRDEHLSLARLQHMNIMPLYSQHVLHARNLQVLCMPFLGGATLAQVLELLSERPVAQRSGKDLIEALDEIQTRLPIALPGVGPFRQFVAHSNYVEAISAIGAGLADGLQYAHDRGLMHMDIKPSNVLLAGDGQPMLLDFHLARGPIRPDGPPPTWMGGTPEFMSPEQCDALAAVRERRSVRQAVDARTDIYSLGRMLYQALGGPRFERETPLAPLHRCNARVSLGLSDIIHKCLQHDPGDRYPDAATLASDLRRHLGSLPLHGVPNRSWVERWRKWRRRRPSALSRGLVLLAAAVSLAAAAASVGFVYRQRVHTARAALDQGRAYLLGHQPVEAAKVLRQALLVTEDLPSIRSVRRALDEELAESLREAKAAELHHLVELIRFRYGIAAPPAEEAQSIIRLSRTIWQARGLLMRPTSGRPATESDRNVAIDLLDLAVVWAALHVQFASGPEATDAREDAVRILDEAEALLGPSPALTRDRHTYAKALGLTNCSSRPRVQPQSAWERYDLGRSYLRSGKLALAARQFELGLELRPQDFWLNFYQGSCAYRLGRSEEAVNAFRVCIALAPESAECYYNRGLAYQAVGQLDRSLADYSRALKLNRLLADASLNRGIIHYRQGRYAAALADLTQAQSSCSSATARGTIHYNLALVHVARGDRKAAASSVQSALALGNPDAQKLSERLAQEQGEVTHPWRNSGN
jgi:serine/threonine protein kinase/tetratricopeptide (TPR) repeat protein